MSSFHPLDSSSPAHPLTASSSELRFHRNDEDDDAWTPPLLPGETPVLHTSTTRVGRKNAGGGFSGGETPLDPLGAHIGAGHSYASGARDNRRDGAAAEEESYNRAVNHGGNGHQAGSTGRNESDSRRVQRDWERQPFAPARGAIPGTDQHQGSLPEAVKNLAGVGSSWFKNVLPTQSYSGGHNGMGASGGRVTASPVEDPLESEWHKQLVRSNQLWVPDSVVTACMVCSRPFNLVVRRHHCRRCGTCMCGWCSHMAVSDKVLSINQVTGAVVRLSSGEPVRCCTPCTRVLDQQLAQALQRKGWGARYGTPAAADSVRRRFAGPPSNSSVSAPAFAGAGGSGYAATSPVSGGDVSSSGETQSFDGGGFAPPSSSPLHQTSGNTNGVGVFGGEARGYGRGDSAGDDHGVNDPLRTVSPQQQQQQQQQQLPPPPPRWLQEPEPTTGEVPSWLGKSSLGSSRSTPVANHNRSANSNGNGNSSVPVAEPHPEEPDAEEAEDEGGVWGNEATDWSNSGSVV